MVVSLDVLHVVISVCGQAIKNHLASMDHMALFVGWFKWGVEATGIEIKRS